LKDKERLEALPSPRQNWKPHDSAGALGRCRFGRVGLKLPRKERKLSDWIRVATFEADNDAVDAMVKEINSAEGPPPGIPAKSIMVVADRENGRARIVVRFDSEENLRAGSATLDAMEPPTEARVRRLSVEKFEVVLERQAP
jgi:hypothetical protein